MRWDPPLVCPVCRGPLTAEDGSLACAPCRRDFPVVAGIPDLRLRPDPWIGLEEDRAKALRVLEEGGEGSFAELVRLYWKMTPSTPVAAAERFTGHVLQAAERSKEWLRTLPPPAGSGPWLDLGCGTADLAEAAGPATRVVGVDVAFRWLVIARRRLQEAGVEPLLVCANAEALPFPDGSFGRAVSLGLLEHVDDARAVLGEARRVLQRGADLRLRTVNRYSLMPEPHVNLRGVGYLPRRLAPRYVRWRTGRPYEHHHPLGARALRSALSGSGFRRVEVEAARALPTEVARMGPGARRLTGAYEALRTAPLGRTLLRGAAPLLEAGGRAP